MFGAISVLLLIARVVIKVHIKVIVLLLKRFDVTNSLIVGFTVGLFSHGINVNIWIKVGAIALIIVSCILIQHFFKPSRIVFGMGSSIFVGLMAYGISEEIGRVNPFIPMAVAIAITAMLNCISWFGIKMNREKDTQEG